MSDDFRCLRAWSCTRATSTWFNGFHLVELARGEAPDFEPWVRNWRTVTAKYGTADLKIATRLAAPTRANWKLVLENFRECYHCYPAHTKSYSYVHQNYGNPDVSTPDQRARIDTELAKWDGKPLQSNRAANPDSGVTAYRSGAGLAHWRPAGEPRSQHERKWATAQAAT